MTIPRSLDSSTYKDLYAYYTLLYMLIYPIQLRPQTNPSTWHC